MMEHEKEAPTTIVDILFQGEANEIAVCGRG